jgi:hypothetical protein
VKILAKTLARVRGWFRRVPAAPPRWQWDRETGAWYHELTPAELRAWDDERRARREQTPAPWLHRGPRR